MSSHLKLKIEISPFKSVTIKVALSDFSVTVPFYLDKLEFHYKRSNSKWIVTVVLENDESY